MVVLGLTTASWMRWRRAIRIIEAEPGLVLVDASRSWRRWNFRGLKDPIARDPRDVLKAAGLSPPTIDAQIFGQFGAVLESAGDAATVAGLDRETVKKARQRDATNSAPPPTRSLARAARSSASFMTRAGSPIAGHG